MRLIKFYHAIKTALLLCLFTTLLSACSKSPEEEKPVEVKYTAGIELSDAINAVEFEYFQGDYASVAALSGANPEITGFVSEVSLDTVKHTTSGGYHFQGYVKINQQGIYDFTSQQSGTSSLLINNSAATSELALAAGFHKLNYWLLADDTDIQPRIILSAESGADTDLAEGNLFVSQAELTQANVIVDEPQDSVNGFSYHYYEADNITFDMLETLEPIEQGNIDEIGLSEKNNHNNMAMVIKGYFQVADAAFYSFKSNTNLPVRWLVGEKLVASHQQTTAATQISALWLEPGIYQSSISVLGQSDADEIFFSWHKGAETAQTSAAFLPLEELNFTAQQHSQPALIPEPENQEWQTGINGRYYYSNQPDSIATVETELPNTAMRLNSFEIQQEHIDYPYSAYFSSQLTIEEAGNYTFYLEHDDLVELQIAGQTLSNRVTGHVNSADGQQKNHAITFFLTAGHYKLALFYKVKDAFKLPIIEVAPSGKIRLNLNLLKFLSLIFDVKTDFDGDKVPDDEDAFPNDPSESSDIDGDGKGDNSDDDIDGDGYFNEDDAFPLDKEEWLDTDGDGDGNNADPDDDNDGVPDGDDDFPLDKTEWVDTDGDGEGNNADPDDDNDLVPDVDDAFPLDPNEWLDTDGDGKGNNADPDDDNDGYLDGNDDFPLDKTEWLDTDGDGEGNNADPDDDNDGYLDGNDDFPLDKTEWLDTDGDGIGNNADPDDDNDDYLDEKDAFPLDDSEWLDTDSDGTGNNADPDDDNDGYLDGEDAFPLDENEWVDTDGNGVGNNADDDDDGDKTLDVNDAFPLDPNEQVDTDEDGIGNNADDDDDNDDYLDVNDDFPLDKTEWLDTDKDGIGNNADDDDDNDGYLDVADEMPLDPNEHQDTDGDGIGNKADDDDDNDGHLDAVDVFPLDDTEWADLDKDGIGDNSDIDRDGDGVNNDEDDFPDDPTRWNDDPDAIDTDEDGYPDHIDAFPNDPTEWFDSDNDGEGDNADPDDDNDGHPDTNDAFPLNPNEWSDIDGDGIGDNSDTDRDGDDHENAFDAFPDDPTEWADLDNDGIGNNSDTDRDGDDWDNDVDAFPDNKNEWLDTDNDGTGNNEDLDDDNDSYPDSNDVFPLDPTEWADMDKDGTGDNSDPDRDGDGVDNGPDPFPNDPSEWSDIDKDGTGDNSDPDIDGDGHANGQDKFPYDPLEWADMDKDGIGDNSDPDRDGDNYNNNDDIFPDDPLEWADMDEDGIGDNSDPDRDGDDHNNNDDVFPDDPTEWADMDEDGIGDNSDPDRDGDDHNNNDDVFPDDPSEWADMDEDGIGDNSDLDIDGDGYDNDQDAFPLDPTRWHSELAVNLSLTGTDTGVKIDWQHEDNTDVVKYRVYRAELNFSLVQIAELDAPTQFYIDQTALQNKQYNYMVEAHAANSYLGRSNTSQIYTAFNNVKVENLQAQMQETGINISWQAVSGLSVIIEKRQGEQTWVPLITVQSANNTIDTQVLNDETYQYRAKTRQNLTDPVTQQSFFVDGPYSDAVIAKASFALNVLFTNASDIQGNTYTWFTRTSANQQQVSVQGKLINADNETKLIFSSNALEKQYLVTAKEFNIALPVDAEHLNWSVTAVSEQTPAQHTAPVNLVFKQDNSAPVLTLEQTDPTTELSKLTLTGHIQDEIGIAEFNMMSDHYPASRFGFITQTNGNFSGEIPLMLGENNITVIAVDKLGNRVSKGLVINRIAPDAPGITITSHQNEQIVTQDTVNLMAVINTKQPVEALKVRLNHIESGAIQYQAEHVYQVQFNALVLSPGDNLIQVQVDSPLGSDSQTIKIIYQPLSDIALPEIQISSPVNHTQISQNQFVIKGYILSEADAELSISTQLQSDIAVSLYPDVSGRYIFSYAATHSDGPWTLIARNDAGETQQQLEYSIDASAPQIQLATPLATAPTLNEILQVPFNISGLVIDDQAVSFSINGEVVNLLPTQVSNQYSFDLDINLAQNETKSFELSATDFAGNNTTQTYIVMNKASSSVDIIAPAKDKQFLIEEQDFALQLVAQLVNAPINPGIKIQIDNQAVQDIVAINGLINTSIPLSNAVIASGPEHTLKVMLYNAAGQLQSESSVDFAIKQLADVPLTITSTQPQSLEKNVETNSFIAFYFNKAVEKSRIQVSVTETAYGKSYVDNTEPGASLLEPKGAKLQQVNKVNAPVAGSLASLPGDHSYAFYPEQGFTYGANIKVEISVDGIELKRFSYDVRALPTLIDANVKDSFGNSVNNIKVSLTELNRHDYTNSDGTFAFGYLEGGEQNIPAGSYTVEINPNRDNPLYGNTIRHINVAAGRRNQLGIITLPVVNKQVPFTQVKSGQGNTLLANGDLKINFASANLTTPTGQDKANMQFSLLETSLTGMGISPNTPALWVFAGQPQGVAVTGDTPLEIKAASFYGSYQYLPADGDYLVLVGRDENNDMLDAVGVAKRQGTWVRSTGEVQLNNLDYIGFARVHPDKQAVLQQYAQGEIGLVQLKALLQTSVNP